MNLRLISTLDDKSIISIDQAIKKKRLGYVFGGILFFIVVIVVVKIVKYFDKNPKALDHFVDDFNKRLNAFIDPDNNKNEWDISRLNALDSNAKKDNNNT